LKTEHAKPNNSKAVEKYSRIVFAAPLRHNLRWLWFIISAFRLITALIHDRKKFRTILASPSQAL
tara:strand:- start:1145 stop:1339 length:195 start_codon:yes stop_codon:yes gene_type:complete